MRLSTFEEQPLDWYSSKLPGKPELQRFEYPRGQRSYQPFVAQAVRMAAGLGDPPITSAEGLRVLRVIFGIYQAAAEQRTVRLA